MLQETYSNNASVVLEVNVSHSVHIYTDSDSTIFQPFL